MARLRGVICNDVVITDERACEVSLSGGRLHNGVAVPTKKNYETRISKRISTSICLFKKPLVEVPVVFMECFVFLVTVVPDFCAMTARSLMKSHTRNCLSIIVQFCDPGDSFTRHPEP